MRIRKRYVVPVLASLAVLMVGVAQAAANNTSSLSLTPKTAFTPSKAPKTTFKSGKLFVHTHTTYTHPGDKAHGGFAKTVTIYSTTTSSSTPRRPQVRRDVREFDDAEAGLRCLRPERREPRRTL